MKAEEIYSIEQLRGMARRRLPPALFDFYDGGSEDEVTLHANRRAFQDLALCPKLFASPGQTDATCEMLGVLASMPIAVAPTGGVGFGWPDGDIEIARAAKLAGIPYTLSTMSTVSLERLASTVGGRLWFQLYALADRELFFQLIERANVAGYEALMLTLDVAVPGKRERDLRNHFRMPYRPGPMDVLRLARHPAWLTRLLLNGIPSFGNVPGGPVGAKLRPLSSVGGHLSSWLDLPAISTVRDVWPKKLIAKGVSHPDDARALIDLGVDALVVSNHGGRQLDGHASSLDLLPGVLKAVDGRVPVFLDGGIRRGSDVLKAIALGASGVLTGRAPLYGTVALGADGAKRAIELLREEFVRSMRLCGVRTIPEIDRGILLPSS